MILPKLQVESMKRKKKKKKHNTKKTPRHDEILQLKGKEKSFLNC